MGYNNISELKKIYTYYGEKRRFRRKSGEGDVVNGIHKGVVVNYHFSINELLPFKINDIIFTWEIKTNKHNECF